MKTHTVYHCVGPLVLSVRQSAGVVVAFVNPRPLLFVVFFFFFTYNPAGEWWIWFQPPTTNRSCCCCCRRLWLHRLPLFLLILPWMILGFPELIRLLVLVLFLVSFDFTHTHTQKKKRVQFNTKVNEIFCESKFLFRHFLSFSTGCVDIFLFFMGHHPFVTHGPSPVVRNESNHVVLYICSHVPRRVEREKDSRRRLESENLSNR